MVTKSREAVAAPPLMCEAGNGEGIQGAGSYVGIDLLHRHLSLISSSGISMVLIAQNGPISETREEGRQG